MRLFFVLLFFAGNLSIALAHANTSLGHQARFQTTDPQCPLGECDDRTGYCQVPSYYHKKDTENCRIDLNQPYKLDCQSNDGRIRTLICTDDGSGLMPWQTYSIPVFFCIYQRTV